MPDISIVTTSLDRAHLLGRLWKSICNQKADFQWVIVDDGSTDSTSQVVSNFNDHRIGFKKLHRNMGVNFARNAGVDIAEGKYLIFLDSDDELVPGALESAMKEIKSANKKIGVFCYACVMAETGKQTSKLIDGRILKEKEVVCENALRGGDNAYIYRKEIFNCFKLPESLKGCEHVFVYSVSKKWDFLVINKPMTLVHRQSDNLSSASSLVKRSKDIAKSYEVILQEHKSILATYPKEKAKFYRKGIYRYGVAGAKKDVIRLTGNAISSGPIKERVKTLVMGFFSLMPVAKFEFWRINKINKKLEGKSL